MKDVPDSGGSNIGAQTLPIQKCTYVASQPPDDDLAISGLLLRVAQLLPALDVDHLVPEAVVCVRALRAESIRSSWNLIAPPSWT